MANETKRSGPGLIDIPAERLKPRLIEHREPNNRRGSRAGKTMIGAYLDKSEIYRIQELLLRLTRERGSRVTMQDAITEALRDWCAKHGVTIPESG